MSRFEDTVAAEQGGFRLEGLHPRRVRLILYMGITVMLLHGLGWGTFFALSGHVALALTDAVAVVVALLGVVLVRAERLRAASFLLLICLWGLSFFYTLAFDVPSVAAPRSAHVFFVVLGVGAYVLFQAERAWVRHGYTLLCFVVFLVLGCTGWSLGVSPPVPPAVQVVAVWLHNLVGMVALYGLLHLLQADVAERSGMEADLRSAVRDQLFSLHYQPQVHSSGRVIGAEALMRWRHPTRGMVSPVEFIPLAEQTGLILPMGGWVMLTACTQLVAWAQRPETAALTLAVNVSARQFRQPDFVAQVLAVLASTGADPARLKLELTESMLVSDMEDVVAKMTLLKVHGVGFSLDDFGTGYSSLSYLKRLPLDQLKIDQSFVRDVLTDPSDAAIARTVVGLGQSLGLNVIAEGVETVGQREFLQGIGCHIYQGFLFSPALPADGFNKLVLLCNSQAAVCLD
jgi:diguanylate cyclase